MNELLSVVLDFDAEVIANLDLGALIGSILKFLNCFRMQSGLNQSRIYLAFASNSYLVYPLEGISSDPALATELQDQSKMHTLAFDEVKQRLLDRTLRILQSEKLQEEEEKVPSSGNTLIHQAIMKAVCFSQQWISQISAATLINTSSQGSPGQSASSANPTPLYDCRILVVQLGKDNPQHFNALVNAVFACQKLRISLDCLVMDQVKSAEASKPQGQLFQLAWLNEANKQAVPAQFEVAQDSHFLQQAANLTKGLYWRVPYQSNVFPYLLHGGFLSSQSLRGSLVLPSQSELFMCTFCVCCKESRSQGHACSHCLSFHCARETTKCRICSRLFQQDESRVPQK